MPTKVPIILEHFLKKARRTKINYLPQICCFLLRNKKHSGKFVEFHWFLTPAPLIYYPKIEVFYRPEWTKRGTTTKWILTIFKYKDEC